MSITKKLFFLAIILLQVNIAFSQLNMSLLSEYPFPANRGDLSDIWGYVDENGNEYALVGIENGVAVVDVTNPTSPNEVFWTTGANTIWRDLKTWNDKAYITNEGGDGLMIIDLAPLPGSTVLTVENYTGVNYPFQTAHNLYIDENGYCYVMGADNGVGGAIILDLNVPTTDPNFEVGRYNDYYLHDGMVRGDTLWGGAINDGFLVVIDVTDKANPVSMATKNTPTNFTHNAWISPDGQTVVTTDEKPDAYLAAYDVSDLGNITELDRIQSSPNQNVIPHNVHYKDNFIVTSYYRDGVTVHDMSNPSIMVEVGNYDTSPAFTGDGFNGCWGVYPWLPSGNIIASDIENGLFVLGVTYVGACYLDGNVKNATTLANLDGVQIDIQSTVISTNSNVVGDYSTGFATAGNYDIIYSKAGFKNDTVFNVALINGQTTTVNTELEPLVAFSFSGQVIEAGTMNPIANAQVRIENTQSGATVVTTNASGNFNLNGFTEANYDVTAGKWGYVTSCQTNETIDQSISSYTIVLDKGYYDDFSLDFNWTATGSASTGDWEIGAPIGTNYNGNDCNPGVDVTTDCNIEAYVTGNAGGGAGDDDIDNGNVVLTSPVFDATLYFEPYVEFDRWFYAGGGNSTSTDELSIKLDNGSTSVEIDNANVNSTGNSSWVNKSIKISDFITPTNNMTLIVETGDLGQGNLVEAGLDKFLVFDGAVGVDEANENNSFIISPNPFNEVINIQLSDVLNNIEIKVFDVTGKMIDSYSFNNEQIITLNNNYDKGIYMINIYAEGELVKTQKLVKF
jgi:choice-of-anchor B domain-containing protein